jgi:hypothetical protein
MIGIFNYLVTEYELNTVKWFISYTPDLAFCMALTTTRHEKIKQQNMIGIFNYLVTDLAVDMSVTHTSIYKKLITVFSRNR